MPEGNESGASQLVKRKLSRKDVHFYVNTLVIELTKKEFQDKLKEEAKKEPVPRTGEELLDRFDEVQGMFFNTIPLTISADEPVEGSDVASDGAAAATSGATRVIYCDGDEIVAQIKIAAKNFPDKETERLLMRMCAALEAQVYSVSTSVPELQYIAEQIDREAAMMSHGHSHGGQPCQHHHDHGHGHSHGQGGMRGRGRGGNMMPAPTPEMERMMEMAMQTLNPEQKSTLERVQKTMNEGSPPSAEDMQKMFSIQQHIMAFMTTMEAFMGGGGAAGRGRGAGARGRGGA